jgi:tetratricopeptide (TPR) repeat protein
MRKTISWVLLAGLTGCGQTEHAPQQTAEAPAAAPDTAAVTTAGPKRITPDEALAMAKELIKKRSFNDASKLLNEAIRTNPQLVEAYTTRATLLADAKQYTRAIADLNAAIKLEPDNAKFLNTRGYFHLLQQNYGEAMADFNAALALDLSYPQPHNNRGLVRIAQEDFDKAVVEFDAALRLDPKYVDAHNNRGFALSRAKKFDDAIVSFTKAIELDPKYINAWNNRAQASVLAGRPAEAIADFTKAIELQPAVMEHYQQRADAYLASGQPELARKDLDHIEWSYELDALNRTLNAHPKDPLNWVARGRHLERVQRWDEALKNYTDALALGKSCPEAVIGKATVLFHQGKLDDALKACDEVLAAGPSTDASSIKGDILVQQGKLDEAISEYKLAQRFDSQVAQTYFKRGQQRKASGEIQQASADMIQAVRMDPSLRGQASDIQFPEEEETAAPAAPGAFPAESAESATPVQQP